MNTNKLTTSEPILGTTSLGIGDFWAWAYSDILSNRNRSIFAEFLVASALNITDCPRVEWDAVDLKYQNISIEVKSAAYIQSWNQEKLSSIRFDIGKKKGWSADTNEYSTESVRAADLYVFCLLKEKDFSKINVCDISQWKFYILPTRIINEILGEAKSISLKRLKNISEDIMAVGYDRLKEEVDNFVLGRKNGVRKFKEIKVFISEDGSLKFLDT